MPTFQEWSAGTVDEARAMYGAYGQRVTVEAAGIRQPFACTISVARFGPLEISRHVLPAGLAVRIDRDDLYGIGISTSGHTTVDRGGRQVTTSRVRAVTTDPRCGPLVVHPHPAGRLESVVVDQWALRAHLEELLGHPVPTAVPLPSEVDLARGPGGSLRRLLEFFLDHVDEPASILHRPVFAAPLCHALLDALLLAVDHPYRVDLSRPLTGRVGRRPVRRAVEAIQECPEQPHTVVSLARLAGVSVRTLQEAFRQQLGVTPMGYLRAVRLARVHADLAAGTTQTVAEVAHRWGFAHLGRFAGAYRARYGVPPSVTARADRFR